MHEKWVCQSVRDNKKSSCEALWGIVRKINPKWKRRNGTLQNNSVECFESIYINRRNDLRAVCMSKLKTEEKEQYVLENSIWSDCAAIDWIEQMGIWPGTKRVRNLWKTVKRIKGREHVNTERHLISHINSAANWTGKIIYKTVRTNNCYSPRSVER